MPIEGTTSYTDDSTDDSDDHEMEINSATDGWEHLSEFENSDIDSEGTDWKH